VVLCLRVQDEQEGCVYSCGFIFLVYLRLCSYESGAVISPTHQRIVKLTADFMALYFGLPVKVRETLPLSLVPERAEEAS